jgi:hypothetical protein
VQRHAVTERRHHPAQAMLSDRTFVELGRQPRLGDLPKRRPPYLAAVATALAFAFLTYLVLGGG